MASIKGGYAMMDLTDVVTAGESGVIIPDWYETLKRIYDKPVWVTLKNGYDSNHTQIWMNVAGSDSVGYFLMGVAGMEGRVAQVMIGTESAESPVTFTVLGGE